MREIPLTRGAVAFVDDADYSRLSAHKWHLTSNGYAARTSYDGGQKRAVLMHREVLAGVTTPHIDHADDNSLNNQRHNLRACSVVQNIGNAHGHQRRSPHPSKYKGVWWHPAAKRWHSGLSVNGERIRLGFFDAEFDAAFAYDREARKRLGEFARLNFPEFWEGIEQSCR